MITRADIDAASATLTETAILSLVSTIRMTELYKKNPSYFSGLQNSIASVDGTIKAKQLNVILDKLESLGIGVVEINQAQTVGTDGLIYSKLAERESLVDYALGILYEGYEPTVYVDVTDADLTLKGDYQVSRLTLNYEGYI